MDKDFEAIVEQIKYDKQPRRITPRELFNAFGYARRTPGNCEVVDHFLNQHSLMVTPHYNDVRIDNEISLEHKPYAETVIPIDPIRRINTLDSANTIPEYVNNDAPLLEATTIMQSKDFSQLPVVNGNVRSLVGYISWESICKAKINGVTSEIVKDYVNPNVATLSPDTPLIKAIEIIKKHDFAVVIAKDKSLFGIVTANDVTEQFIKETESFVLLNELESHLRNLLRDHILKEDLIKLCPRESGKEVTSIDQMTFGDYVSVFGNEEQWTKMKISADRKTFLEQLESIRLIRNDVMYFRSTVDNEEKRKQLKCFMTYLQELTNYRLRNESGDSE